MTAEHLIKTLKQVDPKDVVKIFDADAKKIMPVTGMTFGGDDQTVLLYSDVEP